VVIIRSHPSLRLRSTALPAFVHGHLLVAIRCSYFTANRLAAGSTCSTSAGCAPSARSGFIVLESASLYLFFLSSTLFLLSARRAVHCKAASSSPDRRTDVDEGTQDVLCYYRMVNSIQAHSRGNFRSPSDEQTLISFLRILTDYLPHVQRNEHHLLHGTKRLRPSVGGRQEDGESS
jgi:hypothetical protein